MRGCGGFRKHLENAVEAFNEGKAEEVKNGDSKEENAVDEVEKSSVEGKMPVGEAEKVSAKTENLVVGWRRWMFKLRPT